MGGENNAGLSWFQRIVEPSPALTDPIERIRARLLFTLLFSMMGVGTVVVTLLYFLQPDFGVRYPITLAFIAVVGIGVVVARGGTHWRVAGIMAALSDIVVSVLVGALWPDDRVWPMGCLIALAFSSVFLSARRTMAMAAIALLASGIMMLSHPAYVGGEMILPPLALQALFAPILILIAVHRDRLERERRSELEANQQRLKEAQQLAGIGSWALDLQSSEAHLSSECWSLLGRDELPEPGLAGILSVMDKEDRDAFEVAVQELSKAGGTFSADVVLRNANGEKRFVSCTVRATHGSPRLEGIFQDLTGKVQARRAQEMLERELAEARRMETVGRLAGGIAHDFNNLLTVILGNTSLLQRSSTSPLLDEISQVSDRAAKLVQQLLAFARRQVLAPQKLDLSVLVTDLTPILERLLGNKIDFDLSIEEGLKMVRADPAQLEQVIVNLVVNARDAMPEGGQLGVSMSNVEVGPEQSLAIEGLRVGNYVRIAVRDSGTGMDKDTIHRAFEPFFTTKGPEKGTGLGLATVQGIVRQSGGALHVESALGEGSEFQVYLPRFDAQEQQSTILRARRDDDHLKVIVLVDDEDLVRNFARQALAQAGYEVLCASGGKEALEICEEHGDRVDLLITDVVMPDIGGMEVAKKFRQNFPGLPVLFISGYAPQLGSLPTNAGFLSKPFTPDRLLGRVSSVWTSTESAMLSP